MTAQAPLPPAAQPVPVVSPVNEPGDTERPLVRVRDLVKHFPIRGGIMQRAIATVQAVGGGSFDVRRGEALGLVGGSGCGQTTAGRLLLRVIQPPAGSGPVDGAGLRTLKGTGLN